MRRDTTMLLLICAAVACRGPHSAEATAPGVPAAAATPATPAAPERPVKPRGPQLDLELPPHARAAAPGRPEVRAWLQVHNEVRRNAKPTPQAALRDLEWSPRAAAIAQSWAERCLYAHNAWRGARGENISANEPPGSVGLLQVVEAWASERSDYDYAQDRCAAGRECGHYTQLVSQDTRSVGCGHSICSTGSPFPNAPSGRWEFWVCDYEPPGNVRGFRPY